MQMQTKERLNKCRMSILRMLNLPLTFEKAIQYQLVIYKMVFNPPISPFNASNSFKFTCISLIASHFEFNTSKLAKSNPISTFSIFAFILQIMWNANAGFEPANSIDKTGDEQSNKKGEAGNNGPECSARLRHGNSSSKRLYFREAAHDFPMIISKYLFSLIICNQLHDKDEQI